MGGDFPADAYPTELQPSVGAARPPFPVHAPTDVPPSAAAAYIPIEDDRPEGDSWLWDTNKMPKVPARSSSPNIFSGPSARAPRPNPESQPTAPSFTPPPTGGPAFAPPAGSNVPAETPWWLTHDQPAQPAAPAWDAGKAWEASNVYPPAGQPSHSQNPPAPDYPPAYTPAEQDQQPTYIDPPLASPPFVQRPDQAQQGYSEPPEEQGPSEREMFDENLAESQRWRKQRNWQPPQLPRYGPPPPEGEDGKRKR